MFLKNIQITITNFFSKNTIEEKKVDQSSNIAGYLDGCILSQNIFLYHLFRLDLNHKLKCIRYK